MSDPLDRIHVSTGDITRQPAEAIVNAANESLLGGGGVDGAIHTAAGPRLKDHNRTLGGCPTGLAKITPAFDLESKQGIRHIIHTVGPVWHGDPAARLGETQEDVLLASCYYQCLTLATEHKLRSLAFPAISTGVYGFPKQRGARIAFSHTHAYLLRSDEQLEVTFCCFGEQDASLYRQVIQDREQWMGAAE